MACEQLEMTFNNRFHVWEGFVDENSCAEYRSNYSTPVMSTKWYLNYTSVYLGSNQNGSRITMRLCRENNGKKLQIKGALYFPSDYKIKLYKLDCIMDSDTKHVTIFEAMRSDLPTYSITITFHAWITELTETEGKSVRTLTASSKVLKDMHEMYKKQEHCDFIFICKNVEFRVHKCVLSARSEEFADMFEKATAKGNNRIIISDIDLEMFSELLKFLYCGEIDESLYPKAHHLYYAAEKYRVSDLKDFCRDIIISSLSITTAVETLTLAHTHKDEEMMQKAIHFIASSIQEVKSTDAWSKLEKVSSLATHVISLFAENLYS